MNVPGAEAHRHQEARPRRQGLGHRSADERARSRGSPAPKRQGLGGKASDIRRCCLVDPGTGAHQIAGTASPPVTAVEHKPMNVPGAEAHRHQEARPRRQGLGHRSADERARSRGSPAPKRQGLGGKASDIRRCCFFLRVLNDQTCMRGMLELELTGCTGGHRVTELELR